jgi:hypothetical protein
MIVAPTGVHSIFGLPRGPSSNLYGVYLMHLGDLTGPGGYYGLRGNVSLRNGRCTNDSLIVVCSYSISNLSEVVEIVVPEMTKGRSDSLWSR